MAHQRLIAELAAPRALRRFGSGWYAGLLFALLLSIAGLGLVLALISLRDTRSVRGPVRAW